MMTGIFKCPFFSFYRQTAEFLHQICFIMHNDNGCIPVLDLNRADFFKRKNTAQGSDDVFDTDLFIASGPEDDLYGRCSFFFCFFQRYFLIMDTS